jgi:hypothetical protein
MGVLAGMLMDAENEKLPVSFAQKLIPQGAVRFAINTQYLSSSFLPFAFYISRGLVDAW